MNNQFIKKIVAIIGVVILGAIGSGVWEGLFSPAMSWIGRTLLTIVTLGMDSARGDIYRHVAQGFHEGPSIALYLMVFSFLVMLPFPMGFISYRIYKRLNHPQKNIPAQIGSLNSSTPRPFAIRNFGKIMTILIAILFFQGSILMGRTLMDVYINSAVTNMNQNLAIISPYVSIAGERQARSDFALIKSRENYLALQARIKKVADINKVELTGFVPW